MKKAVVNGVEISEASVRFELDRLIRFYTSHGIAKAEVEKTMPQLEEKALEQAIGAKLLLDRALQLDVPVSGADIDAEVAKVTAQVGGVENYRKALAAQGLTEEGFRKELEKGAKVNKLVEQACAGVPEPTEDEIERYHAQYPEDYGKIRDLLRHEARGRAMEAFVADLREKAKIEYR